MSKTIYEKNIKVLVPLVHDEKGYYHIVYKIVNSVNGKIYIGKHTTKDPFDNYMGSGKAIKQAIEKYGIENFVKEIIFCFISEEEAYKMESELVNEEFINDRNTYNLITGGMGWSSYDVSGSKNYMYDVHRYGEKNPFYGKKHTKETRLKMSKNHARLSGKNSPLYGIRRSEETRRLVSEHHADVSGEKNPFYGKGYLQSGGKNPRAKIVQKIDLEGNVVVEYECMKECCKAEHISDSKLRKVIKNDIMYKGYYYKCK